MSLSVGVLGEVVCHLVAGCLDDGAAAGDHHLLESLALGLHGDGAEVDGGILVGEDQGATDGLLADESHFHQILARPGKIGGERSVGAGHEC